MFDPASAPVPASAAWWPTNLPNCALVLFHGDLPAMSGFYGWTNEMPTHEVWTNQLPASVTNSASGVYFPSGSSGYLVDAASMIPMSNNIATILVAFTPVSYNSYYGSMIGAGFSGGVGIFAYGEGTGGSTGEVILNGTSSVVANPGPALGSSMWFVMQAGASPMSVYTNGVLATSSVSYSSYTNQTLWGINHDNGGDGGWQWYCSCVVVLTNGQTMSGSDLSKFATWFSTHQ